MRDADRQMRDRLIGVLDEFKIEYTDRNTSANPTLCFQINRVTRNYPYRGGDHRANLNAENILRRLLVQNGYSPNITKDRAPRTAPPQMSEPEKKILPPADIDVATVFAKLDDPVPDPNPLEYDAAIARFQTQRNGHAVPLNSSETAPSLTAPGEPSSIPASERSADMPEPVSNGVDATPSAAKTAINPVDERFFDERFLVYAPKPEYVPAEVMIIRLDHDLIASAGDCLIIPIHAKEMVSALSYPETMARYAPKQAAQDSRQAASIAPQIQDIRRAEPIPASEIKPAATTPPWAAQKKPIEKAQQKPIEEAVIDLLAQHKVEGLPAETSQPEAKAKAPKVPEAPEVIMVTPASVRNPIIKKLTGKKKIPLTYGNMLVAVFRAHTERLMEWMPSGTAKDYLDEHDLKQFSARMPMAIEQGLAVRVLREDGPGYKWKLTSAGIEIAKVLCDSAVRAEQSWA